MNLKNIFELTNNAIGKKNYAYAKSILEKELKINPNIFELNFQMGLLNYVQGNLEMALNYYKKTIQLNPGSSPTYCNLGLVYEKLGDNNLAIENYLKAMDVDKKSFKACYNLGNCYFKNDDLSNAEKYYHLSIDISPNNIHPYNNLFQIYDRSNNLQKLDEILNKAQDIFGLIPLTSFFLGISGFRKKNYKKVIENFEKLKLDKNDHNKNIVKSNILAKCYDHLGSYDKAFKAFELSNKIVENLYKDRVDKNKYIKLVDTRLNFFSDHNFNKWKKINIENTGLDPVFLVGFPRSGTTLLDTILRSHSSVDVIEEKPLVETLINELKIEINDDFSKLDKINKDVIKKIRLSYLKNRNSFLAFEKNKLYIDKLPLNIIYIAELNRIFPNAKFILALRNPFDSVLSCFMQPFTPNNAMSNFYNLTDASNLYDKVMQLWLIYTKKLDINVHIIKYEEMVNNFELSILNLLKFLDLEWDDKLKEFYKTAEKRGIIHTPSYNQVNQPLYKKSIERWRNYENKFLDSKLILKKWALNFKYQL